MALVVAHQHYSQIHGAKLIKHMVGKAFQIRPPEALVHDVESPRVLGGLMDDAAQFGVKLIRETRGNLAV